MSTETIGGYAEKKNNRIKSLQTLVLKNEEMAKEANNLNIQETAKPIGEYANSVRKVWEKLLS